MATDSSANGIYLPLQGLRILSFEIAFSLPSGTRTLAELGAEVVRVAGPARSAGQYISVIDGVFLSKPCVGINLKDAEGRTIARQLIVEADVVCSNFTPNVMAAFALSPDEILALNPRAIVVQVTGYGTPGPWSSFPAYGPSTEAAGGLNALNGAPADPPVRAGSGVFSDQLAGRFTTLAILAALDERRRTGLGGVIDLSMAEAITTLLGPEMVDDQRAGPQPRYGNRHPAFAPQGIYPCAGDDEWIAISVTSDEAWFALATLSSDPELATSAFATTAARRTAHDTIDEAIARWTRQYEKVELAGLLQARGVASGPVRKPEDAYFDEHLAARGTFQLIDHGRDQLGYSAHPHLHNPWQFGDRERSPLTDYRTTGADNADVLARWLGMSPSEVAELVSSGVLLDVGPLELDDRPAPAGTPLEPDPGARINLPRTPSNTLAPAR